MNTEESIFAEALTKAAPAERAAYLEHACAGDPCLRAEVEALLRAHDRARGILEAPPPTFDDATAGPAPSEDVGATVGRYKLLERIGEGGMGVVFMAEQTHPVRRRVALKIIKPGLDTAQVIARFEAERQALALMDHPNIAKVLDAGATDAGRPYFVMELVRGIPITEYCDQHHLSPRQRLELFVHVCQAVQHAHTKGVIHRDLKPTNVLVTVADDGRPVPKVIDFGVAKATAGQRLTDRTLFTEFRQLVGTPLYMSPEQAEMSAVMDIDTRSDVYSLGVLLYELLTGTTPFDKHRLAKAAFDEVRRIIREEEPPRPSTRLSTLGETLASVSAQRQTDPKRLGQIVRGELDWIVMRALEKDRGRRYETAIGLAHDVDRYLSDQPVEACPPSRLYRLRKFARRNKTALATTAAILVVSVVAATVSSWQAVRATRAERQVASERDQARIEKKRADEQTAIATAVAEFLNKDVLGQASVNNQDAREAAPNRDLRIRDALDRAAKLIGTQFAQQPLVEAAIHHAIGDAYWGLGESDKAQRHHQEALRLRRGAVGENHAATRESVDALARLYGNIDQHAKAEALLIPALQAQRETLGEQHPDTLRTMGCLAWLDYLRGHYARAEPVLRHVIAEQRKLTGHSDPRTMELQRMLGSLYSQQGEYAKAEQLLHEVYETQRKSLGAQHPDTIYTGVYLAETYASAGQHDKAEQLLVGGLEALVTLYGENGLSTMDALSRLADLYTETGRLQQAEQLVQRKLDATRKVWGERHINTLGARNHLAKIHLRQREFAKAEPVFLEVLERQDEYGDGGDARIDALHHLGILYWYQDQYDKAEPFCIRAFEESRKLRGDQHPRTFASLVSLADMYLARGDYAKAEALLKQAWEGQVKVLGERHPNTVGTLQHLALACWRQGRFADSETWHRRIVASRPEDKYRHDALSGLANVLIAQEKLAEAESVLREVLVIRERLLKKGDYRIAVTRSAIGATLLMQQRYAEAEPLLLSAYESLTTRSKPLPQHDAGRTEQTYQRIVELYKSWGKPEQLAAWEAKSLTTKAATRSSVPASSVVSGK